MAELFRKVYIRSEADLPKEMGIYDVSPNHDDGTYAFDPNNPYDIEHWVNEIDWYLAKLEVDDIITPIEDGLYATGRFTQDECSVLAEGLMRYINESLTNQK